ncbi:LysR family transcriptional regulator [Bordetella genomosp. 10]|nr:LysR family transcriptional regulator [Bordetella genomosp. 10]
MKQLPLIDMHALRTFTIAAQERNMSTAAARLGISQSAVSQTIRNLENQLGAILVNRTERPLSLTPAGHVLADRGSAVLDSVLDLANAVAERAKGVNPSIRLGLIDSFAATCGGRLARALAARTTRLAVRTGLTPALDQQLLDRELDLVISSEFMDDRSALASYPLFTEPFVAIIPSAFHRGQSTVAELRQLTAGLPLIRYNAESHVGTQVEEVLRRHQIRSAALLEFETADTLTAMVSEGLGWALTTPLCILQAEHLCRGVSFSYVEELQASRTLYLLARADQHEGFVADIWRLCRELVVSELLPRLEKLDPRLASGITLPDATAPATGNGVSAHRPAT